MSAGRPSTIYSFHLVKTGIGRALQTLVRPPGPGAVPGLDHAEVLALMTLGAPVLSPARMQLRNLAMFAAWEDEAALEEFLAESSAGRMFSPGWHVRMTFLRRWGCVSEIGEIPDSSVQVDPAAPVVAVTLARMRLLQVPRFIRWGRPVEELVRDHPGQTLALAAMRLPRTVSTFTIWRSQQEMLNMVAGHSDVPRSGRHAAAMEERSRRDFHFEFTTLRFKPISEHGEWNGRSGYVPV